MGNESSPGAGLLPVEARAVARGDGPQFHERIILVSPVAFV
jgi:hypothetical protein